MSRAVFARMSQRLLAHLGDGAVLRGSVACRANIEHGVEVFGEEGEGVTLRSVATLDSSLIARNGETLVVVDALGLPIVGESYRIDGPPISTTGFTSRYALIKVT